MSLSSQDLGSIYSHLGPCYTSPKEPPPSRKSTCSGYEEAALVEGLTVLTKCLLYGHFTCTRFPSQQVSIMEKKLLGEQGSLCNCNQLVNKERVIMTCYKSLISLQALMPHYCCRHPSTQPHMCWHAFPIIYLRPLCAVMQSLWRATCL